MGLLKVATVHNKVTMLEQRGEAASRVHGSIATRLFPPQFASGFCTFLHTTFSRNSVNRAHRRMKRVSRHARGLAFFVCLTFAVPELVPVPTATGYDGEDANGNPTWHNKPMERVSHWATEACDHILTSRLKGDNQGCATFESEHTKDVVNARIKYLGGAAGSSDLCNEVTLILKNFVKDDEVATIPSKFGSFSKYCRIRFSIDSGGDDFLWRLKNFYVTGKTEL